MNHLTFNYQETYIHEFLEVYIKLIKVNIEI